MIHNEADVICARLRQLDGEVMLLVIIIIV